MKKFTKLIGIIACIAVIGLVTACSGGGAGGGGGGGGGGGTNSSNLLKFTGTDINYQSVEVEIYNPNGRSAFNPQSNDYYRVRKNGTIVSSGKINRNHNHIVFNPSDGHPFIGELSDEDLMVSVVPDKSIGIMARTDSADIADNEFTVTSANFDSTVKSIRNTPGEYIITLTDDLLDYPGITIYEGVKLTVKGTGSNQITWKYDPNQISPLFEVMGGYLILENIALSRSGDNPEEWSLLCVYNGMIAIGDGASLSGTGCKGIDSQSGCDNVGCTGYSGVLLKGGAFIMSGGKITKFHTAVDIQENKTSLVISGGTFIENGCAIAFTGSDAFFTMEGGTVNNNGVGMWMSGSRNHNLILDGNISDNVTSGVNIDGNRNITTMAGGLISGNGTGGIITGRNSQNGRIIINGGIIENNGESGVGFHCPGPSFFTMSGGTIKGSYSSGLYIRGPNSEFNKTGGIIYGSQSGLNSNGSGAISVDLRGVGLGYGEGIFYKLYGDAVSSEIYAGTINATGNDMKPDSLKGSGWEMESN